MNRSRTWKWASRVTCGVVVAIMAIGCNPLNLAAFIFAREEKIPAPYPLTFDKEGPKKDKEEVVVLVLPYLAPGAGREFVTADRELADRLAKVLPEMAKENKDKRKVRVINPTQLDKFKMTNPHWKQMNAIEIGEKLNADYVLEIELGRMRLYQPGSLNNIYEGRGEVSVSVYEIGATDGIAKDRYPLSFMYPKTGVRDASVMSQEKFKSLFLENLAVDIARMHVDHKPTSGIADGR